MAPNRALSGKAILSANKVETGEVWLVLLILTHPNLESPLRLVNNDSDITSNGQLFTAFPFDINLPNDEENKIPQAKLTIDNVDRQIVTAVRAVGSEPIKLLLQVILASTPDVIELEYDGMEMRQITYNDSIVQGTLSIEGFLREPYPAGIMNPSLFTAI